MGLPCVTFPLHEFESVVLIQEEPRSRIPFLNRTYNLFGSSEVLLLCTPGDTEMGRFTCKSISVVEHPPGDEWCLASLPNFFSSLRTTKPDFSSCDTRVPIFKPQQIFMVYSLNHNAALSFSWNQFVTWLLRPQLDSAAVHPDLFRVFASRRRCLHECRCFYKKV